MTEEYQRITKILVWIVALSMIAYFVITPFTYFRSAPPRTSPGTEAITPTTTEIMSGQIETNLPQSIPENLLPELETETSTSSEPTSAQPTQ